MHGRRTALVTGAAGFIGSNLLAALQADPSWDVIGVDDLSNGHLEFVKDRSSVIVSDFASDEVIKRIKRVKFDAVIHLAAVPRVSYSVEHPLETNDTNVSKTLKLVDACAQAGIGRFVFASSSSVYGGRGDRTATGEDDVPDPRSPYALQKLIIEQYLRLYHDLYKLDSVCMRFFNVFGPNQLGDSPYATAVSAWLSAIVAGRPMRSDGDGTQSRDMCYVDNVVSACIKAASAPGSFGGRPFNVACGSSVTNNQIIDRLKDRFPASTVVAAPWRAGDVMHTLADVSSAQETLGYKVIVPFWEGLDKTIEWALNEPLFKTLKLRT